MILKDPFLSNEACIARLYKEYKKHKRLIVAVDFDDTVYNWSSNEQTHDEVLGLLKRCKALDFYVVVFTASLPKRYTFIEQYMRDQGIEIDSINKNPIDLPFGNDGGKIYYNIFLCDRAGLRSSFFILETVVSRIEQENAPKVYLEASHYLKTEKDYHMADSVFLAGSTTTAVEWQKDVATKLAPYYTVFNPRRANFDTGNIVAEREQITWEHYHLQRAKKVLFWFSNETLAPITQFELGRHCLRNEVYIGIHPDYPRKRDVEIRMELEGITDICYDIETLVKKVIEDKR